MNIYHSSGMDSIPWQHIQVLVTLKQSKLFLLTGWMGFSDYVSMKQVFDCLIECAYAILGCSEL